MIRKPLFRLMWLAVLPLLFTTCTKDDFQPVEPEEKMEVDLRTTKGKRDRTLFKAFFKTEFIATPSPTSLQLDITGTGRGLRLGRSTFESASTVDFTTPPPFTQTGNVTFTAANGDQLFGHSIGTADPFTCNEVDECTRFKGNYVIGELLDGTPKDGTGRFEGATGSGVYYGSANVTTGEGRITFIGLLFNP